MNRTQSNACPAQLRAALLALLENVIAAQFEQEVDEKTS